VVEAWLRADLTIKGTVVHERLVAEYGFTGHYQRVKMFLAEARPRIAAELADRDENPLRGLHRASKSSRVRRLRSTGAMRVTCWPMSASRPCTRSTWCSAIRGTRFAVSPPAWIWPPSGTATGGRSPTSAGCPGAIVYDRTKTVIRRHVAPGIAVPLHPEAAAFADHYGFTIDVLAAYRPTGKGRVERQVNIVRDHVLAGPSFESIAELDGAFTGWLPIRRRQVHRTHSQVIAVRAEADRAALAPLPEQPYLVGEKHLRRVGKDCLISFQASYYSVPARLVRPGQRVQLELHIGPGEDQISIHALAADGDAGLTSHHKATRRSEWVIDPAHWAGLPDGHTRAVTLEPSKPSPTPQVSPTEPLSALLVRRHAELRVAARPLAEYAHAASVTGTGMKENM
jgi:hypothetical protein